MPSVLSSLLCAFWHRFLRLSSMWGWKKLSVSAAALFRIIVILGGIWTRCSWEYAPCYKDQDCGETGREFGSGFSRIFVFLLFLVNLIESYLTYFIFGVRQGNISQYLRLFVFPFDWQTSSKWDTQWKVPVVQTEDASKNREVPYVKQLQEEVSTGIYLMLYVISVSFDKSHCDLVTTGGCNQKAPYTHHVFCKHVLYKEAASKNTAFSIFTHIHKVFPYLL